MGFSEKRQRDFPILLFPSLALVQFLPFSYRAAAEAMKPCFPSEAVFDLKRDVEISTWGPRGISQHIKSFGQTVRKLSVGSELMCPANLFI